MSETVLLDTVKTVMADVLGVGEGTLNPRSSPDNIPAWDSLKHIEIVTALEQELGVSYEIEEIEKMTTLQVIVDLTVPKLEKP